MTVTAARERPKDTWAAAALRAAMEAAHLSQAELARRTGIDRSIVNALANARRPMTQDSAERLAEHLPVRPTDLLPPPAGEVAPGEEDPLGLLRQLAETVEAQQGTIDELQARVETLERAGKKPARAPRAGR